LNILKKIFGKSDIELKCFDEIENVFHGSDVNYGLVFFPLCSINTKNVIPTRNEWIHFVDVWNNGDVDDRYFHQDRTRDLIKFNLENSKYHYNGDITAFPKQSNLEEWCKESKKEFETNKEEYLMIPDRQSFLKSNRKRKEVEREEIDFDYYLYVDQMISYFVTKERYKRKGQFLNQKAFPKGYKVKSKATINQIGGKPKWIQQDMTPIDIKGKPLTFIGDITGFNYMANGSDRIYLFLDETADEVVQIMQYG